VQWWFTKADRRVSVYYFYLWDVDFGPAFIKVCNYFPYPVKIWLNGHEWVKHQATRPGSASRNYPMGSQILMIRLRCKTSVTGSVRAPSMSSSNGGWPACPAVKQ
jgi:hypothetical protein